MCQRHDFLVMSVDVFEDSYFEDKVLVWFFQTIKKHYLEYGASPDKLVVAQELKKAAAAKLIKPTEIRDFAEVASGLRETVNSQQYMTNEVVRFCRRQVGRKVYLETAPLMDTATDEDWDNILEKLHQARNIGNNYLDVGSDYFAEIQERIQRRRDGTVTVAAPTGIRGIDEVSGNSVDLDSLLGGGCKQGQLAMWLGGTGVGKSIALPHCGRRAVAQGFNVVHYTLELSEQDITDRYDAGFTGVNIHDLIPRQNDVSASLNSWADGTRRGIKTACAGKLIVKEYPTGSASVNTIKSHLRQLEGKGWFPDVIIVDYLDLLKPLTSYNDEYSDLGAIARDLRGLAGEYKVSLWSATQVNRAGMQSDVIDIEHIGDSLKKAQIADIILGMMSNREERANNELRIFGAKNRNGPARFEIRIPTGYHRMKLYDPQGGLAVQVRPAPQGPAPTMPEKTRRRSPKN